MGSDNVRHWWLCGCVIFAVLLLSAGSFASAHELLPKEVVQFIKENPNATPEELKQFAEMQDPAIAKRFNNSSGEEILRIVRSDTDFFHNGWDFLKLGIRHILSGPDHILFVLSLLLVFNG